MYIAVDFDGTCVTHDYPNVGKDIGAIPVLKALVNNGHLLILNTMRDNKELQDAIDWFENNEIVLFGANENPSQKSWTTSPKAYANIYIDDAALGCPLKYDSNFHNRAYVDWNRIAGYLHAKGLITYEQYSETIKTHE